MEERRKKTAAAGCMGEGKKNPLKIKGGCPGKKKNHLNPPQVCDGGGSSHKRADRGSLRGSWEGGAGGTGTTMRKAMTQNNPFPSGELSS